MCFLEESFKFSSNIMGSTVSFSTFVSFLCYSDFPWQGYCLKNKPQTSTTCLYSFCVTFRNWRQNFKTQNTQQLKKRIYSHLISTRGTFYSSLALLVPKDFRGSNTVSQDLTRLEYAQCTGRLILLIPSNPTNQKRRLRKDKKFCNG